MRWLVYPALVCVLGVPTIGFCEAQPQPRPQATSINSGPGTALATKSGLSGERLFLQCRACHTLTTAQGGKVGPALGGMFSRGAGTFAGYSYSDGLRAFGGSWTDARLDSFLAGPNRTIAGTKMAFAGIPDAQRRAALIAYLRANTRAPL